MEKLPIEYPPDFKPSHLGKRRSSQSERTSQMPFNYRRYSQQLVGNLAPDEAIDIFVRRHKSTGTQQAVAAEDGLDQSERRGSLEADDSPEVSPKPAFGRMGRRQSAYARLQRDFGFSWDSPSSIKPDRKQRFNFGSGIEETEEEEGGASSSPPSSPAHSDWSQSQRRMSIEDSGYLSPDYADLRIEYTEAKVRSKGHIKSQQSVDEFNHPDDYYLTPLQRLRLLASEPPVLDIQTIDAIVFEAENHDLIHPQQPEMNVSSVNITVNNSSNADGLDNIRSPCVTYKVQLYVITGEEADLLRRASKAIRMADDNESRDDLDFDDALRSVVENYLGDNDVTQRSHSDGESDEERETDKKRQRL